MISLSNLEEAEARIRAYLRKTPLTYDEKEGIFIKWENRQITGSFKVRGAFNKIMSLQPEELKREIVAASAGNHGQGVALAASTLGARATIFVGENAVAAKVQAMRALGAQVRTVPGGYGEAETAGLDYAAKQGAIWISPYNDLTVIAGQGTLGLETARELPDLPASTWIVPVGGGGLISGIGVAIKSRLPSGRSELWRTRLIGVQSQASPFFHAIFHQGCQENVKELPSLADGLSGPVQADSATIPLVQKYVDDLILVSEEEIEAAIAFAWKTYAERIEGSAAVALAAIISGKIASRPAVIIISGGNIQPETHARIVGEG